MNRLILFLLLLSSISLSAQAFYTQVGEKFPDFRVSNIHQEEVSNATLEGKPSLIVFFGTRCPPCLKELKVLKQGLDKDWLTRLNVVLVGSTDDASSLKRFKEKHGYDYTIIPDENQLFFNRIGDHTIPRTFLLDRDMKIIYQYLGYNETPFKNLINLIGKEVNQG